MSNHLLTKPESRPPQLVGPATVRTESSGAMASLRGRIRVTKLVSTGAILWALIALFLLLPPCQRLLADEVTFQQDGKRYELQGEIIVQATDGGVLFRDRDAKLWLIQANEIESKLDIDESTPPYSQKEISESILKGLPDDFRVETTDHWVIAYNTERAYAKYLGGLYERLLRGFTNHWKSKRKWKLEELETPLVAVIFRNFDEYQRYVQEDLGIVPPPTMVAYYNLMTNRVIMYDLTSTFANPGRPPQNDRQILEILSNPNAIAMVATIIHEGTHQLMFNLGMQQRLAATPLWVNEGLAMYFETPDMRANQGWRAIGQINVMRLSAFRVALSTKPRAPDALKELISNDELFRDPTQLLERYAEAWALNYFLLTRHSEAYVEYLKFLSEKEPLIDDDAETRLADFQKFFPDPLEDFDREFLDFIRKLQ